MSQYKVKLANVGNPDRGQDPSRSLPGAPGAIWLPVESLPLAAKACRDYIERHDLGAGNWSGGEIREVGRGNTVVASVSYNGRVWAGASKNWSSTTPLLFDPATSEPARGPRP